MRITRRTFIHSAAFAAGALASATLVTGCARFKVEYAPFAPRPFPPTDRARVQVLFEKPSAPHVEIGSLSVRGYPDTPVNELLSALISTAAERGANAIIVQNRDAVSPRVQSYGGTTRLARPNELRAVAIRFMGGGAAPGSGTQQGGQAAPIQ